jgi:hypothetical protein
MKVTQRASRSHGGGLEVWIRDTPHLQTHLLSEHGEVGRRLATSGEVDVQTRR